MNKMKPIEFVIGEETKPVIVDQGNYKDSLLGEQIEQAYRCIVTMEKECRQGKSWEGTPFKDVHHNNIISYVGERGSGKTSCMYSVANILREERKDDYICLDAIDPSFFDEHHNILQIVIGKLYCNFKDELEDNDKAKKKEYEAKALMRCFRETKKHLKYLNKEPEFIDDNEMEDLNQLASGVDLKSSVKRLVNEFLRFNDKKMLLISIDDIDQNFTRAYEMAEQLRKYLIIPGVIIQMAAKMDQLTDMIQNKMAAQYVNRKDDDLDVDFKGMAERYLVKLLPLESRIFMPDTDIYFEKQLRIIYGEGSIEIGDVKTTVTQLIFQKCRYLFYNTKGTTSYIVPRNLRELRMLISMLVRMPDFHQINIDGMSIRSKENKDAFKNYFFGDWMNNLSAKSKEIAKELIEESEPTQFNKKVVQLLADAYEHRYRLFRDDLPSYIKTIISNNTVSYNISIGDVFTYMDFLSRISPHRDNAFLLFFIKSLYSIKLFEYYDMLVNNQNSFREVETPKSFRRDDLLENVSYLQKLVGGSFYYLSGDSLIATAQDQGRDNQRELRIINGNLLNGLIRDVCSRYPAINEKSTIEKTKFTQDLRMAEFFMLTVSRFVLMKSGGREYVDFRLSTDVFYNRDLSRVQNMEFNVMAPFFHLLDVRHAYGRFHAQIFQIAQEWNDEKNGNVSLYNMILKECHTRKDIDPERDMLSKITIRNAEVAEDLYAYLEREKYSLRPGGVEINVLAEFYRKVFSYYIATYDYKTGEDGKPLHYVIRFMPFKVLSEFLYNCKDQEKFYSIYNEALIRKITPYQYLEKSMSRVEIWNKLNEMYPTINSENHLKEFKYRFQSNKKYAKSAIVPKLDALSKSWGMKLDGTSSTNA